MKFPLDLRTFFLAIVFYGALWAVFQTQYDKYFMVVFALATSMVLTWERLQKMWAMFRFIVYQEESYKKDHRKK